MWPHQSEAKNALWLIMSAMLYRVSSKPVLKIAEQVLVYLFNLDFQFQTYGKDEKSSVPVTRNALYNLKPAALTTVHSN